MVSNRRVPKNRCWAEGYGCEGSITREHVVSDVILKEFGNLRHRIGGKEILLGSSRFKTSSLCERHNKFLSDLDAEAGRFFLTWKRLSEKATKNESNSESFTFCGNKIEKWFAKTMVNSIIFRHQAFLEHYPEPLLVSFEHIKNVLFGGGSFKSPFGLYTIFPGDRLHSKGKSFFCLQAPKAYMVSPSTGRMTECETPFGYMVNLYGLQMLGVFNVSPYEDNIALSSMPLYSPVVNMLDSSRYRWFNMGFGRDSFDSSGKIYLKF